MMTVPVASRPRRPALPAIWMYSPVSTGPEEFKSRETADSDLISREIVATESDLAAGFGSQSHRAF